MKLIYCQPQGKKNNQTHTHIQTNKTSNNKPLQTKALTMTELSDPTSLKTDEHFDQSTVQNEMRSHAKKKWGILYYYDSVLRVFWFHRLHYVVQC